MRMTQVFSNGPRALASAALLVFVNIAAGCYGTTTGLESDLDADGLAGAPVAGNNESGNTVNNPVATGNGLPCDVENFFKTRCQSCHGSATKTAGVSLVTYEDVTQASTADASQRVIDRAAVRAKNSARPMPPSGGVASTEVAPLDAWIAAGTPRTECVVNAGGANTPGTSTGGSTTPDPSTGSNGGSTGNNGGATTTPPAGNLPPAGPCASQKYYASTDPKNGLMMPGRPCLGCHSGPPQASKLTIAGTVYPTNGPNDVNDCQGVPGGVTVEITDSVGVVMALPVNAAGNFSTPAALVPPFKIRVNGSGRDRFMFSAAPNGNCNACHGAVGQNGAPGRILAP